MDIADSIDTLNQIAQELDDLSTLHAFALEDADGPAAHLMRVSSALLEQDAEALRFVAASIELNE